MAQHRTSKGLPFDMAALAAANDRERAVSNVPRNARGDVIDGKNKIVIHVEDINKEYYSTPPTESVEVSLKQDPIPEPTPDITAEEKAPEPVKEEVKPEPKPKKDTETLKEELKPKAKAKPKPKPAPPPTPKYVGEVYEKHSVEGEVEISRNKKTREDGTAYWEIEYSDGSILDIEIE
tara:strand:- start:3320 stop:3853 length:534 start_codon:yes stop_codon:yes gene_type:complete